MAPPLRIASVPAAHPYVAHLGTAGVVRLPDPQPPGAPAGRWWPPVMVDPDWIGAHAGGFDLLHVHFGVESFSPAHLEATVAALCRAGRPLVLTVHDLENPQLDDQARHRAQLDVLVPAADAVVTLTAGAAEQLSVRWGRAAQVIPHPHLVPFDAPLPPGRAGAGRVAGLHLRDLRPNVDGPGATALLLEAVAARREQGVELRARVVLHDRVRDPAARDAVRAACAGVGWVELVEAPRPGDAALHAELADLDVSVLPYAHGTHSGWLELCWDLGVAVAAPAVGCFAEQHQDVRSFTGAGALAAALEALEGAPRPGTPARAALQQQRRALRRVQAAEVEAAHLALYRSVV